MRKFDRVIQIKRDPVSAYIFAGLPLEHQMAFHTGTLKSESQIIRTVMNHFGVTMHQLKSKKRTRDLVIARQIVMWFLRKTHMSLVSIGAMFERDHSTVIYSLTTIDDLISYDNEVKDHVLALMKLL